MPTGRILAPLADIPNCECLDGPPVPAVQRKHPVVTVPMLPRRRDETGEPVGEIKRGELDEAVGPGPGRADPLAALGGGSTSRTKSVIRAFESVEIPLFSQASMSDVVHSDAHAASNRQKKSSSPQKGDGRMLERGGRSSSESSRT